MRYISSFGRKLEHLWRDNSTKKPSLKASTSHLFNYMVFHVASFWINLCYFLVLSLLGFLALKVLKPRSDYKPSNFNLFFTSVSATTVSSMSTVEMEVFSSKQLIILTILMFLGGEVFTSYIFYQLERFKCSLYQNKKAFHHSVRPGYRESSIVTFKDNNSSLSTLEFEYNTNQTISQIPQQEQVVELGTINNNPQTTINNPFTSCDDEDIRLRENSMKHLGNVVLGYFLIIHIVGPSLISLYISSTPSAHNVLKSKGLILHIFSIFTTVSTFSNCGFIPTNENMIVFRTNPGLLLILIPQILLGNTLYMPCLRLVIYVLHKISKRKEYNYMLINYNELSYDHLKSSRESLFVAGTNIVFLVVQFVVFSAMEWNSGVMEGMNSYQKFIGSLFQTTNARHSGESILDLSAVSSALLVLFSIMMYLPPYTTFLPIGSQKEEEEEEERTENSDEKKKRRKNNVIENMLFSPLAYLALFVVIICITERLALKEDPLNFNVINIVIEVTSAYGNVGFTTGYSCKRRLTTDTKCVDKWYGFVGKWSDGGKFALILVMFMGRLKKFNLHGGKAWKVF